MKERSRELIKEALVHQLESLNMRLSNAKFNIEMKERTIRDARSAGARTRARNELEVMLTHKNATELHLAEVAEALTELTAPQQQSNPSE